jgi:ElaB/YqjD/DUF883 family membrane-anchored ribosome-binding protein
MAQSLVDKTCERIDQTVREASRVTSAVADAIENGVRVAKRATKQGREVAEDLMDNSTLRVRQNPLATITVTLAAGFAIGMLAGLAMRRK